MRVAPMNSRFLDACRRRPTDVRPVWFMRQAGRYLRAYREVRAKHSILEICKRPDLASLVTLQPVEILDVDGRIGGFNFQWAWSSGVAAGDFDSDGKVTDMKQALKTVKEAGKAQRRFHVSLVKANADFRKAVREYRGAER